MSSAGTTLTRRGNQARHGPVPGPKNGESSARIVAMTTAAAPGDGRPTK